MKKEKKEKKEKKKKKKKKNKIINISINNYFIFDL